MGELAILAANRHNDALVSHDWRAVCALLDGILAAHGIWIGAKIHRSRVTKAHLSAYLDGFVRGDLCDLKAA